MWTRSALVRLLSLSTLSFLLATAAAPALAESHPFSVHDLVAMERLGDPAPSPDGRWIVFSVRRWDAESNEVSRNLWLMGVDGRGIRRLTTAQGTSDDAPAWMPDSRTVAFLSTRGGSSQVWTIRIDGGEAAPLTSLPVDVDTFRLSPAGDRIALSAEVYPDCEDLRCTADRNAERDASPVKALVFEKLMVRHWDRWFDGRRNHILTMAIRAGAVPEAAGEPVDLLKGLDHDSPTRPFGGNEEYAWSPDGSQIAFTAKMVDDAAWSTDLDIYTAGAEGGPIVCITSGNEAVDTQPVYSPDGSTIAYLAMKRPRYEADRYRIALYDRRSGSTRVLTEEWDRSPSAIAFSPDGKKLIAAAGDTARKAIFAVDLSSGKADKIIADHSNSGVAVAAAASGPGAGRIVFAQESFSAPKEIFTARLDGSELRRITRFNDDRLAEARRSEAEEFWFKGARGDRVHGWILKPVDYVEGNKYPLALIIHGGPQGSNEDEFHYRWNPQPYAGAGYVVVMIDFHGSTGYGQEFSDSIRGQYGGLPYEDLMKGVDHVLETYPFVNGDRMCALGASFGGYMINWIAGQTDRFRCLVTHDGEFDSRACYYATEELWFPEWDSQGTPWENPEGYEKWSAQSYVANWKTPMLIIHGAKDFRLPETEALSAFNALQRLGIPSKFLYFPDENHWVLKAKNSILWHETVIDWLDRWAKGSR